FSFSFSFTAVSTTVVFTLSLHDALPILGFISMVEGYLAALFIDVAYQNNGAGKELLNFEKRRRNKIRLKVYKENLSAVRFYEKNGFIIKEELTDEQTNKQE